MNSYPQRAHHLVEETKKELEINLIITIIRMTLEFIDLTEISLMIKKGTPLIITLGWQMWIRAILAQAGQMVTLAT